MLLLTINKKGRIPIDTIPIVRITIFVSQEENLTRYSSNELCVWVLLLLLFVCLCCCCFLFFLCLFVCLFVRLFFCPPTYLAAPSGVVVISQPTRTPPRHISPARCTPPVPAPQLHDTFGQTRTTSWDLGPSSSNLGDNWDRECRSRGCPRAGRGGWAGLTPRPGGPRGTISGLCCPDRGGRCCNVPGRHCRSRGRCLGRTDV